MSLVIAERQWKALSSSQEFFASLPQDLREFVSRDYQEILRLPRADKVAEFSTPVQPSVEFRTTAPSYLDFLRNQIALKPRGETWNRVLERRWTAVKDFTETPIYCIRFHSNERNSCSVWLTETGHFIHWEIYSDDLITITGEPPMKL